MLSVALVENFISRSLTMSSFHLVILNAIFMCVLPVNASSNITIMDGELSAYQPGDIILGGLFPAHLSQEGKCGDLDLENVALVEAMIYTVNRVNKGSFLPWNLTLGYDIRDTCNVVSIALKRILSFLSEKSYSITDDGISKCGTERQKFCDGKLVSVIGAGSNEISVAVNKVLSVFKIPQIGYAATSGILSDKSRFPSFSRTVVPGSHQPEVMTKVMSHFKWTYVALLISDNTHWRSLSLKFKNLAHTLGICIGVEEVVPYKHSDKDMESIIQRIQSKEKLEIILLFTSALDTNDLIIGASTANMSRKLWIASEVLPNFTDEIITKYARVSQGMMVIANELESVVEFSKYFEKLTPENNKRNPWFKNLWEKVFGCLFLKDIKSNTTIKGTTKICTGAEKVTGAHHLLSFSYVNHVIDAVMSVCHVIKRICSKEITHANATQRRKMCLGELTKSRILSQMFMGPFVFDSLSNRKVFLDSNGDAVNSYRIQNLQIIKGKAKFYTVGKYTGNTLDIHEKNIEWPNNSMEQPSGKCSLPCKLGSFKIKEGSRCCWRCSKCPTGYISIDALKCTACEHGFTSNKERTFCRKKTYVFMGWDTASAGAIIAISLICFGLSLFVYVILLKYKKTPVVSGMGSETNFRLLWSITFGVLVPFAYIGYPNDNMCKIQTVLFGTSLTLSMSLVLAKTKQVTCKRKNLTSKWRVVIYDQNQIAFSLFLTIVELLICILWIINKPPSAQIRDLSSEDRLVVCTNTTSPWFVLSTFHIFIISIACTYLSYNFRKRLVNFSETKYILYSMLAFYSVWVIFTAVVYGTPDGLQDVTMNCLLIIASQMIFLGFIFFPKLFIIFFKRNLNKDVVFNALASADGEVECRNSSHRTEDENPHKANRPHSSFSFRDSREFPSDISLELKSIRPHLLNKLSVLPCCSRLPFGSNSADSPAEFQEDQEDVHHRLHSSPYPLPVIAIDEGSRSQTSDTEYRLRRENLDTYYPSDQRHCTCEDGNPTEDHEYQAENIVSLTVGRNAKVWKKRNGSAESNPGKRKSRDDETRNDKADGQRSSTLIMKDDHAKMCETRF